MASKSKSRRTSTAFGLFSTLPKHSKPTCTEVGKGFLTAPCKSLRLLYFSFLEENVHGWIQASSFKWSWGAWHQVAMLVQFYCRHMRAETIASMEILAWEILEAKSWGLVSVATLKQDLSSVQEWRTGHEVLWKCRSGKVVKPNHKHLIACAE